MVTSHYYLSDDTKDKSVEIYPFSNWIRSLSEYFFYDFIALLCDIGGSMSFYIGVSCLSLVDVITWAIDKQKQLFLFHFKKKTKFEIKVINRVQNVMNQQPAINNSIQYNLVIKFKKMFVFLMWGICSYLIYHQCMAFTTYSTYQTIALVQEEYIQIPPFVVCTQPDAIYEEKEKIRQINNTCVEDIDILDLLDKPSIFAGKADYLWQESSDMDTFDNAELMAEQIKSLVSIINYDLANKSSISTVFGKCIHFESAAQRYTPRDNAVYIPYQSEGLKCNSISNLFLMQTSERINIKPFSMQPLNSWMFVEFFKQTVSTTFISYSKSVGGFENDFALND
uniref:Uncharacterized protein n=1 Tax=Strigamia maritima TaxID=126957 RepID=T1JF11_STRMM